MEPKFYCSHALTNDNDDDDHRLIKRIMQNVSTVLCVPVHCEEVSLQL